MSLETNLNYWAIGVAAVVAFVIGALWNSTLLFGAARLELAGLAAGAEAAMSPAAPIAEFVRCLIVATVLAIVIRIAGITGLFPAMGFAALLWLGFQAALLAGGVIWEKMPVPLYAIHVGDALVKMLAMSAILSSWR